MAIHWGRSRLQGGGVVLRLSSMVHGGSPRLQTLMHSFVEVSGSVYTALENPHQLTMLYLNASEIILGFHMLHLLLHLTATQYHLKQLRHDGILPSNTGSLQNNDFFITSAVGPIKTSIINNICVSITIGPISRYFLLFFCILWFLSYHHGFCILFFYVQRCVLPSPNTNIIRVSSLHCSNSI